MLAEKIIFNILAFALFVYVFFDMIRKNDTNYVSLLIVQAIGITINFIEIIFGIKSRIFIILLRYVLAIILPILVIILEYRKIKFLDYFYILKAEIYFNLKNNKKAKEILIYITENSPENYSAHKLLGKIYESEGGMRKAIDEYVKVIEINKQDYQTYYKISYLLHDLGKKDEAATMINALLKFKPDYFDASRLLRRHFMWARKI